MAHTRSSARKSLRARPSRSRLLFGLFLVSLAQRFGDQRAAARAEHKAHRPQEHQERHDEIHRRERAFTHKVGHKKAVHHAVDGSEHQHDHGGEGKPQKFFTGEMIRETNLRRVPFVTAVPSFL